jgi:hypothetical protein
MNISQKMNKYHKISKVIALWNSYCSLEGSDLGDNIEVQKAMDYCLEEIERLGFDNGKLPSEMDKLIKYLKTKP